jgi:polygalacturonase
MDNRMVRTGVVCAMWVAMALCVVAAGSEPTEGPAREAAVPLDKLAATMVNSRDHGVVGNGEADDTQALQAALNAAEKKGPACFLPAGQYRINGSLVVPPGVTLCGASGGVPHSEHPVGTVSGLGFWHEVE